MVAKEVSQNWNTNWLKKEPNHFQLFWVRHSKLKLVLPDFLKF